MTDVLFKIFDLLLGGLISKYKQRAKVKSEFEEIKRKILYTGIVNDLPILLKELRDFIIQHNLVEKKLFELYFSKWLNDPIVMLGVGAGNAFSSEQITNLKNELIQLKL